MGEFIENISCPKCSKSGNGKSLSVYTDGKYCNECGYSTMKKSQDLLSGNIEIINGRGLNLETLSKYNIQTTDITGHLYAGNYVYNEKSIIFNFYNNGKICKQKIRSIDDKKKITQIGATKKKLLFGQQAFTPTKKIPIIITEGELDAPSVYQAMKYPAVSIGGASDAHNHIIENLEWLSGWAHVVLCFDSDEAGRSAVDKCIPLFEVGKVRVAHLPLKDANDMIKAGREEELKKCIWNAEILKPSTLVTISDIRDRVLKKPNYGEPWHYKALNEATYGLMSKTMYVVAAAEGIGKTEFVKEMIFHLLEKKVNIGLFSFEQDPESTIQRLIGSKINKRLHLPNNEWWDETVINNEMDKLQNHIHLYDNRGSLSLDTILLNIRYLVKCYDVKFIVIDNLTAMCSNPIVDGHRVSDYQYINEVAGKLSSLINELKISMCIVAHLNNDNISKQAYVSTSPKNLERYETLTAEEINKLIEKPGMRWETGRMPALENIYGGGTLRKLADYIIVLARNKTAEDAEEKRTTKVKFLKCRLDSSNEGNVFELKYNYSTGRLDESDSLVYDDSNDVI